MRVKLTTKDLVIVFLVVTMIFDNAHAAPGKFIITDVCITKRVEKIEHLIYLNSLEIDIHFDICNIQVLRRRSVIPSLIRNTHTDLLCSP